MEELHTFAVLCYGESPYLSDCVRSLLAQSVKSRIFLSTATPNPYIWRVAEEFGLPVLVNPNPPGIATDWQFAAEQCQTPYYTLAHQDDLYYPRYTEELLPLMARSIIAFCDYEELVGESTRRNTPMLAVKRLLLWPFLFTRSLKRTFTKRIILRFGSAVCCPSVMYSKERVSGFRFNPAFSVDLDWDAWLTLSERDGAFSYRPRVLMAHRIHADSETTRQIESNGRHLEDRLLMERLWPGPVAAVLSRLYKKSTDSNGSAKAGPA